MADPLIADRLAAWREAGIVDSGTAARIEAFEAARPAAPRPSNGITVSEVIAYIGTVVLLVGVGFLYGTQYQNLGSSGRLILIGVVAVAGYAAGELVRRMGGSAAARRARAAGWSVAVIATTAWLGQLFADNDIGTRPPRYPFEGAPPDVSGSILLALLIGAVIGGVLLWRAGAGLLGLIFAALAYGEGFTYIAYQGDQQPGWGGEIAILVPAAILIAASEVITRGPARRWAREILRFTAVVMPVIFALILSQPDDQSLELFAGALAVAGFGLALVRGSAGYAIAAGVGLFIFVNEVGFRHFSDTLGFPVVLIISGVALFAISGGLVGVLRRLRRAG